MRIIGLEMTAASRVMEIQALAYYDIVPESESVMLRKLALSPHGCFAALEPGGGNVAGYILSHPWKYDSTPELHEYLESLPENSDSWYIHDLALTPLLCRIGAGRKLVERVLSVACECGFQYSHLVSIQESCGFWNKMGFVIDENYQPCSYGDGAFLMRLKLL